MAEQKFTSVTVNCVEPDQSDSNHEASQTVGQQWSAEPAALVADHRYNILMNVYDVLLCTIPLFLIAKTSLCIYAHHVDKNNSGSSIDLVSHLTIFLLNFNEQLVTAFTIVFVTIVATMVRRIALYRAQQGATVSDLEQLQASISLPSTIKTVFSLRKFTFSSAALLIVWSFYYLGSQSSKREYGYAASDPYHHMQAIYPIAGGSTVNFSDASSLIHLNEQLHTSADPTSKNLINGVDKDGNVLIPLLQHSSLAQNTKEPQWVDVTTSHAIYSAYAGRPLLVNFLTDSHEPFWLDYKIMGSYTLNTTYMDVQCGSPEMFSESAFPSNVTPDLWTSINKTTSASPDLQVVAIDLWGRWTETWGSTPGYNPTFEINGLTSGSIRLSCNVTNVAIKLRVVCTEVSCLPNAMQYVPPNATDPTVHPLANDNFTADFFSNLLLSYGLREEREYGTKMEMKIGLSSILGDMADNSSDAIADHVESVQDQLGVYFNTYYNLALAAVPVSLGSGPPGPEAGFGLVNINGAFYTPHFALSWPWIAVSYCSGVILVIAASISFWLRRHTLAPDIFGYVSSLTRDNPHLLGADGGSTMSGIDRARYLKNVRIQISDVHGQNGEIGKVGVTIVQDGEGVGPLRKERKYI